MNECPVAGCPTRVPSHLLMCAPHWRLVPADKRNAVWRTYRRNGVLSAEYQVAREAAIEHVNKLQSGDHGEARIAADTPGHRGVGRRDEAAVLPASAASPPTSSGAQAE